MRTPIFGVGLSAKSPVVSSQRRLNLYLDIRPDGDKSKIVAYGTPGLDLFLDFGDSPARGHHSVGNFLYVVHRGIFWEVNNAGVKTNRGNLLTSVGRVYFADNGTKIMIVDGSYGYTYDTSTPATPLAQITDVDYVAANSVTWQDGFFIQDKVASGRWYISAINDPTSWDALDFANAEASPDNLVRVIADHGELLLFGDLTIEFWGNSGFQDFPYVRLGSAVVEWGLAARESLTKFDSSLMFLGRNRMGEAQVVRLNGYTPQPVGSPDFLTAINKYTTVNDATAYSYMHDGHAFYQINFPTANTSWLYDGKTDVWSELQSDSGRHRGNIGTMFLGKMLVSDYSTGKMYRLNTESYTDNGTMIQREIISRHIIGEEYLSISRLWIDMETGVGLTSGQGSDPQAMLSWSKDGGRTWSSEVWRSFGKIGNYLQRVFWNRLGSSRNGWTFKLRITEPVKVAILNEGWLDMEGK